MPPRGRRAGSTNAGPSFGDISYRANNSLNGNNSSSASLGVGTSNTTVNVAQAFASASQFAGGQPNTMRTRGLSRSPQPPFMNLAPARPGGRMLSPAAEMVAHAAQATTPAKYFLTAREEDAYNNNSRRSPLPPPSASEASEEDDSYGAEEAYTRSRRNAAAGPSQNARRGSKYDDDAWRPERLDSDGDSGAGDEAVLPPRQTRNRKRQEAPSFGGGALGLHPTPRARRESSVKASETPTPGMVSITRADGNHTPVVPVIPEEEPGSPTPTLHRGPTPARAAATKLFEGFAGVLLVDSWFDRYFRRPLRNLKRQYKNNPNVGMWLALAALAIAIPVILSHLQSGKPSTSYVAPTKIPTSMEDLAERVVNMEGHLQGLTRKVNMERQETTVDIRELRDLYNKLRIDHNNVAARQESHGSAIKHLEGDMASLKARVSALERDTRATLDDGRLKSALERILPRHLPVRYEKGSMTVDPHFYAELKKLFVGTGEVETTVRKMIDGGVQAPKDHWSVNKYERELEAWADRMFDRWTSDSKYIERDEFIDLVHKELREAVQEIKVTPGLLQPPPVTIRTAKGEDITAPFQALVDAALLKYSKDTLGMADYALFTAGGRVIPELTTETFMVEAPQHGWKFWLAGQDGKKEGRMPATALHPDNSVGSCWPFAGSEGQIGIMLARQVVITSVTVEHAAPELAFSESSAPKSIEVWGSVSGEKNRAKAKEYLANRARMAAETGSNPDPSETSEMLKLAEFTYDAHSSTPIQTFPVPADIIDLGIDLGVVVFRIKSNWGGDFTCLYRVRVHGTEIPAQEPEAQEEAPQEVKE